MNMYLIKHLNPQNSQKGFSLIELMISIALGLLIMTGVLSVYSDLSRSNTELAKMNHQIENGRFTVQLLQQELWHAGFWDGYMPPQPNVIPPTAVPNPCVAFATWDAAYLANMFAIAVQGYADGDGLPAECAGIVSNRQPGSDVLVIRHAETCVAGASNCSAFDATRLYIQTQGCSDTGNGNFKLEAETDPIIGVPGIDLFKKDCVTPADRRRLRTSLFYIRNYSVNVGDGIPTLMRADANSDDGAISNAAQAIVEGVQSINFQYGRDTAGDGIPDVFDDCAACAATDWADVVALRVYVLARNLNATAGYNDNKTYDLGGGATATFNDNFMRHSYNSYVRLINVAGRRDTPVVGP